ncbi:MAG: hypothetical protein Q8L85_07375 [Alphaproteobacteria bacterium]|nr:hypothetical protein [Alphaproteobacteria bacterium]
MKSFLFFVFVLLNFQIFAFNYDLNELESNVKKEVPSLFMGDEFINQDLEKKLKKSMKNGVSWSSINLELKDFFNQIEFFIEQNKNKYVSPENYKLAISIVLKCKEDGQFTYENLFQSLIAALAGFSNGYHPEEIAFFGPFQSIKIFEILKEGLSEDSIKRAVAILAIDNQIKMPPLMNNMPSEIQENALKMVQEIIPERVYYPLFSEEAELGVATLIRSILDHIYLLPVTSQENMVHSIMLSPFAMFLHDYLHGTLDGRNAQRASLLLNVIASEYTKPSDFVLNNLKEGLQKEAKKKKIYDKAQKDLYALFLVDFLKNKDEALLKKRLAAYFLKIHDVPTGSQTIHAELFSTSMREEINNTIGYLQFPLGALGDIDPLDTSALSEITSADDETILKKFVELHNFNPQNQGNPLDLDAISREGTLIFKDPFGVLLNILLKDGQMLGGFFLNYNLKLKFAKDYHKLLTLAGVNLQEFSEEDKFNKEKVAEYVASVRSALADLLTWFSKDIDVLIKTKDPDGTSIDDRYSEITSN